MHRFESIKQAKKVIESADALFIGAGAGMGVDSGLPDFRGKEGFWKAYPKARELGLCFEEMANPVWFERDPQLAWAFYGHRLHLYRDTLPHRGFKILKELSNTKKHGNFVFTSNVDGQFQKAGFETEKIMECHGSIHHLQCTQNCRGAIWSANDISIDISKEFRAKEPLPRCPYCNAMARPNILMFGDWEWESSRTDAQRRALELWLDEVEDVSATLAVVEIGAGRAVPTVRHTCEAVAKRYNAPLIRMNPREPEGADIMLASGALDVLEQIADTKSV